jgi:hypothetical protein
LLVVIVLAICLYTAAAAAKVRVGQQGLNLIKQKFQVYLKFRFISFLSTLFAKQG